MKGIISLVGLFFTGIVSSVQACFTDEFQAIWNEYQRQGLEEQYALYGRFFQDHCARLTQLWGRPVKIGVISCRLTAAGGPHCISKPEINEDVVTFNICWLDAPNEDGDFSDPAAAAYWKSAARPIIQNGTIIAIGETILQGLSVMRPPVVFLHELTHLLLRMDFILNFPEWTPDLIQRENSQFEHVYSRYILGILADIDLRFSMFMAPDREPDCCSCCGLFSRGPSQEQLAAEALAERCYRCWGGIDEILVIMGVKLVLEGEEYVLGETMLLRKLAALQGLTINFVCWSHQLTFLPNPLDPESQIESPRELDLCPDLFLHHRDAFMALCHHLSWDDILQVEESQEDAAAVAGTIPIFPDD